MTKYPNSACEAHKEVKTSVPICIVCLVEENQQLKDLISDSALLCWANSSNTEEAYEWKIRAEKLLKG